MKKKYIDQIIKQQLLDRENELKKKKMKNY